jgi:hypothetical protein
VQRFIPNMEKHASDARLAGWSDALARVLQQAKSQFTTS